MHFLTELKIQIWMLNSVCYSLVKNSFNSSFFGPFWVYQGPNLHCAQIIEILEIIISFNLMYLWGRTSLAPNHNTFRLSSGEEMWYDILKTVTAASFLLYLRCFVWFFRNTLQRRNLKCQTSLIVVFSLLCAKARHNYKLDFLNDLWCLYSMLKSLFDLLVMF